MIINLKKLGAIENGYLNISRIFTTDDLKVLLNNNDEQQFNYIDKTQVNQLVRGWDHVYRGRANEVTAAILKSIPSLILKPFFNYRVSNPKHTRKKFKNLNNKQKVIVNSLRKHNNHEYAQKKLL